MTNPLGDLISKGEGGYNSYNRGTKNHRILPGNQVIEFSGMTLDELRRRQQLPLADPDRIFAVGKYQLVPATMSETIDHLKLPGDARLTPELQERMFADHLIREKRPEVYRYILGDPEISLHSAQKAISNEWASVDDPDTPGRPAKRYYDAGNRSSTRQSQIANALNEMRGSYKACTENGLSPAEAWRSVTGQIGGVREHGPAEMQGHQAAPDPSSEVAVPKRSNPGDGISEGEKIDGAKRLQESLAVLGYQGLDDHRLAADGHLGPNTLHAIKSFQHAHHLHVDGIVGPRTLAALEEAKRYPLLSESTNPHHRLYEEVVQGIRKLPHEIQPKGRELENAAVALTLSAVASGVRQVDHVVLGRDGVNLFAVQGRLEDPSHRRTYVELAHAARHGTDHRDALAQSMADHAHTPVRQHAMQQPQMVSAP